MFQTLINDADKYEYLSSEIFDFTTYDTEIDKMFVTKAVEVCRAITNRETFEYIKDDENYKWFLIMCNMPFFADKIEWGTSIRGAWWSLCGDKKFKIESCGFFDEEYEQILEPLEFNEAEWKEFIMAVACFIATSSST